MARRYNPAREYLEPIVTRTEDGREFTDGPGFPMPVEKWEEDHEQRKSHKEEWKWEGGTTGDSASMSDSGIASGMAMTARMADERRRTDAEIARLRAEIPTSLADMEAIEEEQQILLIDKKNPSIEDVLDFNMEAEPDIVIDRSIFEAGPHPRIPDGDSSWGSAERPPEDVDEF